MIIFRRIRIQFKIFCLLLILIIPSSAPARLLGDHISPYVNYSHVYDDNLFRLSDDIDEQAVFGIDQRSDQIQGVSMGVNVDLPISQQHLFLELDSTKNSYHNFTELNHTQYHFLGKFVWQYGSRLKGTVSSRYDKQLNGFEDFFTLRKDLIKKNSTIFDLSYRLDINWTLRGAYSLRKTEHGISEREGSNLKSKKYIADLRYKTSSKNYLGMKFEMLEGDYYDRLRSANIDDQFKQYTARAISLWNVTAKSIINTELGYTSRKWSHISSKNFSSPTGLFEYEYHYSEKLSTKISLEREVRSVQNNNASFSLDNSMSLIANWLISDKVNAQVIFNYVDMKYQGGAGDSIAAQTRHDKDRAIGLSLNYAPFDNTIFSLGYNYKKKTSNIDFIDFDDSMYHLNARMTF